MDSPFLLGRHGDRAGSSSLCSPTESEVRLQGLHLCTEEWNRLEGSAGTPYGSLIFFFFVKKN